MKSFKWNWCATLLMAVLSFSVFAYSVETEIVDGIKWTYEVDFYRTYAKVKSIPADTLGPITIPSTLGGAPVTEIEDGAFENCNRITSAVIPEGVVQLGDHTFRGCAILKSVSLPSTLKIASSFDASCAFEECVALKSISLPEGVEAVSFYMFEGCTALSQVTLPTSLKTIYGAAFGGCDSLEEIVIPEGTTTIKGSAFQECKRLKWVTLPSTLTELESAFRFYTWPTQFVFSAGNPNFVMTNGFLMSAAKKELRGVLANQEKIVIPEGATALPTFLLTGYPMKELVLPNSMAIIEDYACGNCDKLTNIIFNAGLLTIGEFAFSSATAIKELRFPEGMISIGEFAFSSSSSLRYVEIPSDLVSIGRCAFPGVTKNPCTFVFRGSSPQLGEGAIIRDDLSNCNVIIYYPRVYANQYSWVTKKHFGGYLACEDDPMPLHFDANGGYCAETERIFTSVSPYGVLPVPTRFGYKFLGWFTEAASGEEVTAETRFISEMTVYAHWQAPKPFDGANYDIVFDSGEGSGTMNHMSCKMDKVYVLSKCKFSHPTKKFAGWQCSNGRRYDDEILVFNLATSVSPSVGEITMTAIWE